MTTRTHCHIEIADALTWPLRSVANEIQAGRLYTAVKRKEWLKKHGAAVASDAKGGER